MAPKLILARFSFFIAADAARRTFQSLRRGALSPMRATASVTAFHEQKGHCLLTKRGNIKFRERMGAFLLMRMENDRVGG
jgi:hypothetical protein